MFLHADNDGYKLDANHDTPIEADDLPMLAEAFVARDENWQQWQAHVEGDEWTEKWWFADTDGLRAADFNLSAGRHRPQSRSQVEHLDPMEILDELKAIEREIMEELDELSDAVREVVA